ncbi:hypothetical protein B0I37DRAFT_22710 [Chaetomium sp. MPI-CAGE-AT-0009]|nr:hypothetical protein B0I37DRAFT_22710 [Chaetomium sp. MPI-CAGE-AT-0009]
MNQCRGPKSRLPHVWDSYPHRMYTKRNRLAARSLGPRQQALSWPSSSSPAGWPSPTAQPAKKDQGRDHPQKCEFIGASDIRVPSRAVHQSCSGRPAVVCAPKPGPAAQSGSAAGSIPCFAVSDAPFGGLTQPRAPPPTHSHKDQGLVQAAAGCCQHPISHFAIISSARFWSHFQPTQPPPLSTSHSLSSPVGDCVFRDWKRRADLHANVSVSPRDPFRLFRPRLRMPRTEATTDCQNTTTKQHSDPVS